MSGPDYGDSALNSNLCGNCCTAFTEVNLVHCHRNSGFDGGSLKIVEFIAHDSLLRFESLNHASDDSISGKPPCPEWPPGRTWSGHARIDKNDPKETSTALQMNEALSQKNLFADILRPPPDPSQAGALRLL
jgi:hypothetical protein